SDWQSFLARVGTPAGIAGATPAAKQAAYAQTLKSSARSAFPTEYLRGRAAVPFTPIRTNFITSLLAANPNLDLTRSLPDDVDWRAIPAADRSSAQDQWSAFRREASTFRRTPSRTLLNSLVTTGGANPIRSAANQFLVSATDLDLEHTTVE